MDKRHREALKAFRKAGLDVEVVSTRRHLSFYLDGELVHTASHGTKQTFRADADIRRKIRRIQEGQSNLCERRFNRD